MKKRLAAQNEDMSRRKRGTARRGCPTVAIWEIGRGIAKQREGARPAHKGSGTSNEAFSRRASQTDLGRDAIIGGIPKGGMSCVSSSLPYGQLPHICVDFLQKEKDRRSGPLYKDLGLGAVASDHTLTVDLGCPTLSPSPDARF
jgi:hypothetical protein